MEPQMITALVLAERRVPHGCTAGDPHRDRRVDSLHARERAFAARARVDWRRRVRASLARGIRRLAEAVEPPRPVCVAGASDRC